MADPVTVATAAAVLGVPTGTVRRWVREGCPVAQRGRRGRGHAVLVDPDAVIEWRVAAGCDALLLQLAGAVPDVMAAAVVASWQQAQGIDKRQLAGISAATWYFTTTALLDHLREHCDSVPEVTRVPDAIDRLRKIAR